MRTSIKSILIFSLLLSFVSYAQEEINIVNGARVEFDKCGFPMDDSDLGQFISPEYMDYSYDSLLIDLELWRLSEYVKIDSIGLSVQGRPLWQLTISNDPNNVAGKRTVHIHARTHPQETEGFYVTEEMIEILLSETEFAQTARANCVFYVIPMFNPDGPMVMLHLRPIVLSQEIVTDSAVRRLLFDAGDYIDDLMTLCEADITSKNPDTVRKHLANFRKVRKKMAELEARDSIRKFQPPISGDTIQLAFEIAPCREIGIIKNHIKDAILDGIIPNNFDDAWDLMIEKGTELGLEIKMKKEDINSAK